MFLLRTRLWLFSVLCWKGHMLCHLCSSVWPSSPLLCLTQLKLNQHILLAPQTNKLLVSSNVALWWNHMHWLHWTFIILEAVLPNLTGLGPYIQRPCSGAKRTKQSCDWAILLAYMYFQLERRRMCMSAGKHTLSNAGGCQPRHIAQTFGRFPVISVG